MMREKVVFPLNERKAPAVPHGTDWRDYHGEAQTDLVGLMIPVGVVVFDIDSYKGTTTSEVDSALGVALDWSVAELQTTMNGGQHYVFRVPDGLEMTNGQNVAGVNGFDTRSSLKGYIATGKGYTNLTFMDSVVEALHDVELWPTLPLSAALKISHATTQDDLSDLESAVAAQPLELSAEEIALYMSKLPYSCAEDGELWLKVGMGLYHQFQGSDAGWQLFDEFSKQCADKYDPRMNRKRWDSFGKSKRANPVTFASVIELAGGKKVVAANKFEKLVADIKACSDKEGLTVLVREASAFKLDEINSTILIGAIKKQFAQVTDQKLTDTQVKKILRKSRPQKEGDFYEDYVFITATGEYMHRETKTTMGPRAFDVKHSRYTPVDGEGNPQRATSYVDNRIECVHSGMYAPMFADIFAHDGVEYFNTYKPNTLERKPSGAVVDMVKKHIAHLLPDPVEQQLVINYLAHNVQFPGVKIQWAMMLQGVQGDGKSFFAEMMQRVMGQSNCSIVSAEVLDDKYTAWSEGTCMVFFEELKLDNFKKYETINKLKPFITNPTVSVRKMYRDPYEAINTVNYFALTNYKDALPIDDTDRRYCVLFSQWQNREKLEAFMADNPNYYPDIYETMREGAGEILDWLLIHKIPGSFLAMKRAPATRAKEQMQDMAKSDDWLMVEDAIEQFKCGDINEHIVNVTKLQKLVSDSFDTDYTDFPKKAKLKNTMLNMGYQPIGRYKNAEGKNQNVYCKDDCAKPTDFRGDYITPF